MPVCTIEGAIDKYHITCMPSCRETPLKSRSLRQYARGPLPGHEPPGQHPTALYYVLHVTKAAALCLDQSPPSRAYIYVTI